MSCYHKNPTETVVTIPRTTTSDGVVYYEIVIKCWQNVEWHVKHRYRDFDELHDKLIQRAVGKELLPGKKVLGNKNTNFLRQRQEALEKYLQIVSHFLQIQMPLEFVEFLDFHRYDIVFLLQHLALKFFHNGDQLLLQQKPYAFSLLEVHAMSERMKLPCPSQDYYDKKYDFSHILDFCMQLKSLELIPEHEVVKKQSKNTTIESPGLLMTSHEWQMRLNTPIGNSSIIPSALSYDLNIFTSCRSLKLLGIAVDKIVDIDMIRKTCEHLKVFHCSLKEMNEVLLCDDIHKSPINLTKQWPNVKTASFQDNFIQNIDETVTLMPNISELSLENNKIKNIQHLSALPKLTVLNLSANLIETFSNWHLELGNLLILNLARNKIVKLSGLSKLYSLKNLDLSFNNIADLEEIDNLTSLPCLEQLCLNGNLIAQSIDYRARILSRFNERLSEVAIDNERGTQSEIDKALVLSALRMSRMKL